MRLVVRLSCATDRAPATKPTKSGKFMEVGFIMATLIFGLFIGNEKIFLRHLKDTAVL